MRRDITKVENKWKCTCGSIFSSNAELLRHIRSEKKSGNAAAHKVESLVDESGNTILDETGKPIRAYSKARSLGLTGKQPQAVKQTGGQAITALQPKGGAIVFSFGREEIPLEPGELYDAYQYYEEIKRNDIDVSFSTAIKDSMKYAWRKLKDLERMKATITIKGEEE